MAQARENILGTEKISRLLLHFSLPTVMTLMVNVLYNIADQIFIGHAEGIYGMAATNAAFPMMTIGAALALMVGDGCASRISLCLGRREQEEADKTFGNALVLLALFGILLAVFMIFGRRFFALLFGATADTLEMSMSYLGIVALGLPFQMTNMAFTAIIRSDGNPGYTMRCMMIGAGLNVILDPVFIFGLHMGVTGAAVATIIGQVVAGILCLLYIPKLEHFRFAKENLRPSQKTCGGILLLGVPSGCMQSATALMQIVMNRLMVRCGSATIYGSEMVLSCYGAMMKIYQIAHAMFVGVASGTQPINGYNYGAKQYGRVWQTFRIAVMVSFVISGVWFLLFQTCGGIMGRLFVEDTPLYLECMKLVLHVYMMGFFVYGLPQVTASFFQAVGHPWKSLLVALSRQVFFLIPLSLFFAKKRGLVGVLAAAPVADVLAFLLSAGLIFVFFRRWKKQGIRYIS